MEITITLLAVTAIVYLVVKTGNTNGSRRSLNN